MPRYLRLLATLAATWAVLSVPSCSDDPDSPMRRTSTPPPEDAGDDANAPEFPFEPVAAHVYVAKVKNLLTGLPPTAEELAAVTANPEALEGLIDGWVATPQAQDKLLVFLSNGFQQTQFLNIDFGDMLGQTVLPGNQVNQNLLAANIRQSFARTVLGLVAEGRPFTDAVTTKAYTMTPAMMSFLALIDSRRFDDAGRMFDKWYLDTARANPIRLQNMSPVAFEQSINPASPNYMNFYAATGLGTSCPDRAYPAGLNNSYILAGILFGRAYPAAGTGPCSSFPEIAPVVTAEDFTTWKKVTIRRPNPGEKPTKFWDLPKLRATNELVLDIPRVGFFSTLAFQANWRTNTSNLARLTINQTLIVALGASFEADDLTVPLSESGLDAQHADPSSPCYGCHKTLDPMRGYFRKNLTLNYHEQLDPKEIAASPSFSFDGVTASGNSIDDLARTLADHPRFPIAWAQKICFYADSAPCSEDDPEFQRVVKAFKDSGMNFKVLLRELFASPLITGAARTKTFQDREVVVSVSRYDHLCRALTNRLGVDACNVTNLAKAVASNLPRDSYSRGGEQPVLNSDVSLFYRTGVENLCRALADVVIDAPAPATTKYKSADKDAAIRDFVHTVMALADGDPRAPAALEILEQHYQAALTTGAKPADALKSTFVLSCSAPSAVSIGL